MTVIESNHAADHVPGLGRLVNVLLVCLVGLAAVPAAAAQSTFPQLAECSLRPLEAEGACTATEAHAALEGLEPEWGYRLRSSAGVDAFAIVSVLSELKLGLEVFGAGDCARAEEHAYAASEIWTWYVTASQNMTEQGAIDLAVVSNFLNQTVDFLSNPEAGACP